MIDAGLIGVAQGQGISTIRIVFAMPLGADQPEDTQQSLGITVEEAAQLAELLLQRLPRDQALQVCRWTEEYHRNRPSSSQQPAERRTGDDGAAVIQQPDTC